MAASLNRMSLFFTATALSRQPPAICAGQHKTGFFSARINGAYRCHTQRRPRHHAQRRPRHYSQHRPRHYSQRRPRHYSQRRPQRCSQHRPKHHSQRRPKHHARRRPWHHSLRCLMYVSLSDDYTDGHIHAWSHTHPKKNGPLTTAMVTGPPASFR